MLNHILLVTVSLGICHLTHMSTCLDLVVYEPVRTGSIAWEVAFEMIKEPPAVNVDHCSQQCHVFYRFRSSSNPVQTQSWQNAHFDR